MQMNSELRHAQLELLSAECAAHQLRLRFSIDDIARYAQKDTLRKAVDAANVLHQYYSSIQERIPIYLGGEEPPALSNGHLKEAIDTVMAYFREQRNRFYQLGQPLEGQFKESVGPFFSSGLMQRIHLVQLQGERLPNPAFYADARAHGLTNLPEITHMASMTFMDVIVFNDQITAQALFHALVHAVQFHILGPHDYTESYVRSLLQTKSHVMVPLEAHAFSLDAKFAGNPVDAFSVEDEVRSWVQDGRY
jgi:hypothetical protein